MYAIKIKKNIWDFNISLWMYAIYIAISCRKIKKHLHMYSLNIRNILWGYRL
jgi:hypothetical protein